MIPRLSLLTLCYTIAVAGGCALVTHPAAVVSDRPISVEGTIVDENGQSLKGVRIEYTATKMPVWTGGLSGYSRGGIHKTVSVDGAFDFSYWGHSMQLDIRHPDYFPAGVDWSNENENNARMLAGARRAGWSAEQHGGRLKLTVVLHKKPPQGPVTRSQFEFAIKDGSPQSEPMAIKPPAAGFSTSRPTTGPQASHAVFLRAKADAQGRLLQELKTRYDGQIDRDDMRAVGLELVMTDPRDGFAPVEARAARDPYRWMREAPTDGYSPVLSVPPRRLTDSGDEPFAGYVRVGGRFGIYRIHGYNRLRPWGPHGEPGLHQTMRIIVSIELQAEGRRILLPDDRTED